MAAAPEGATAGLRNLGADDLFNERVRLFQEFLDEDVRIYPSMMAIGVYREQRCRIITDSILARSFCSLAAWEYKYPGGGVFISRQLHSQDRSLGH